MKILLSKPERLADGRRKRRHIVMTCTNDEMSQSHEAIWHHLLNGTLPNREHIRTPTGPMWRYRFRMEYLEKLMLMFPFAEFSPALENRLTKRAREKLLSEPVPELDIPEFRGELYDFQKIAVAKMIRRKRFFLNDEMGLGKTVQALAAIVVRLQFGGQVLAVVPNSIKFQWKEMIERFTDCTVAVVHGTAEQRRRAIDSGADIIVINTEGLRAKMELHLRTEDEDGTDVLYTDEEFMPVHPGLFNRRWNMVVVDEYHRFKNPTAQQSIGLHHLRAKRKLAMSGTPILNGRPEELWSILHWMYPRRFNDYNVFVNNLQFKRGSKVIAYNPQVMFELKEFLDDRCMRRRKDQVLDDLPEVVYVNRGVDMTGEQRRLYNEIKEEMLLWIEDHPRDIINALAQLTRLKQACFSPELYEGSQVSAKIDELRDIVRELVANGEKAIIFSQWSKATRILQREFEEYNPAYIDGTVKVQDRMGEVHTFNNDPDCKLFIGTIGSCKEGFTLSAATYVIFTDVGWTPAENQQAAARSAAGGLRGVGANVSHVHIIELKANETIEQKIDELLAHKKAINDRMVENDGGFNPERITMSDIRELLEAA